MLVKGKDFPDGKSFFAFLTLLIDIITLNVNENEFGG